MHILDTAMAKGEMRMRQTVLKGLTDRQTSIATPSSPVIGLEHGMRWLPKHSGVSLTVPPQPLKLHSMSEEQRLS